MYGIRKETKVIMNIEWKILFKIFKLPLFLLSEKTKGIHYFIQRSQLPIINPNF